jgi:DNA-binding transcriptional MerR regulator
MNYSEVKELLQAGFTAEEIRGMLITPTDNSQNSQDNPQEEQPQPVQPEEQPQPVQPEENQDDAKFNQLNATMEKLIKTIQLSNLNNNSFDHMKETDINAEVDKIMAGLIRPEREKGGN